MSASPGDDGYLCSSEFDTWYHNMKSQTERKATPSHSAGDQHQPSRPHIPGTPPGMPCMQNIPGTAPGTSSMPYIPGTPPGTPAMQHIPATPPGTSFRHKIPGTPTGMSLRQKIPGTPPGTPSRHHIPGTPPGTPREYRIGGLSPTIDTLVSAPGTPLTPYIPGTPAAKPHQSYGITDRPFKPRSLTLPSMSRGDIAPNFAQQVRSRELSRDIRPAPLTTTPTPPGTPRSIRPVVESSGYISPVQLPTQTPSPGPADAIVASSSYTPMGVFITPHPSPDIRSPRAGPTPTTSQPIQTDPDNSDTDSAEDVPLPTTRKQSRIQERIHRPSYLRRQTGRLLPGEMHYGIDDVPPWYLCLILGFQHYLIMFGATIFNSEGISEHLCFGSETDDMIAKSELVGTIFFASGIATLLQTTIGVRLPIVQGGTFTFVTPVIAILTLPKWKCPTAGGMSDAEALTNGTTLHMLNVSLSNMTSGSVSMAEPLWKPRMREIQGAIIVASLFQVVIGFTGLIGFVLRFIGPLAITPTITLVGLALFDKAADLAANQWWITLVTVVLIVAFSQYSKNLHVPCFHFKRGRGCHKVRVAIFRLFPVLLAVGITWAVCAILVATNVFPSDPSFWVGGNSTKFRLNVVRSASWFRVPYPGQWGMPTVSVPAVFGMLSGVLASMVESVGDYYACARISNAPPPPMHAVNRGIGMEGIGSVIAGLLGHGSGTTSYSENIGTIGITRVASRRVVQTAGVMMLIFGVVGKCGTLFSLIPDPIVGGVFIVMFGMITAVGISNLQFVDLNSSRNLFIIGFSFFFGLTLPAYLGKNPDVLQTGVSELDQILTVLLKTNMFVGGMAGFVLDNTIPGTNEERGLRKWRLQTQPASSRSRGPSNRSRGPSNRSRVQSPSANSGDKEYEDQARAIYEISAMTRVLRRWNFTRFVPFLPTFDEQICECFRRKKKAKRQKKRAQRVGTERRDGGGLDIGHASAAAV